MSAMSRPRRRSMHRLVARLTRRATSKLAITARLPPFLRIVLDYEVKAPPANDNGRHHRRRPAQTFVAPAKFPNENGLAK